mmetsp:Transcript_20756/g.29237  ORF Transcript_20756/g.29237 Transcript_20756/m.29237 type:complete len:485 (+) Transcript_20756:378-1832(+)
MNVPCQDGDFQFEERKHADGYKLVNFTKIVCLSMETGIPTQLYQGFFTTVHGCLNPVLKQFFCHWVCYGLKQPSRSGSSSSSQNDSSQPTEGEAVSHPSLADHVHNAANPISGLKRDRTRLAKEGGVHPPRHHLDKDLYRSSEIEASVLAFLAMQCVKPMVSKEPVKDLNLQSKKAEEKEAMIENKLDCVNPVECFFWISNLQGAIAPLGTEIHTEHQEVASKGSNSFADGPERQTLKIKLHFQLQARDAEKSLLTPRFAFTCKTWSRRLTGILIPLAKFLSRELGFTLQFKVECEVYDPFRFHHPTPGFWKKAAHGFFLAHQLCCCVDSPWSRENRVLNHDGVRVVSMELLDQKSPLHSEVGGNAVGPFQQCRVAFAVSFAEVHSKEGGKVTVDPVYSVECRKGTFAVVVYSLKNTFVDTSTVMKDEWIKNVVCSGLGLTEVETKVEQIVRLMPSHRFLDARSVCCAVRYLFNLTSCLVWSGV